MDVSFGQNGGRKTSRKGKVSPQQIGGSKIKPEKSSRKGPGVGEKKKRKEREKGSENHKKKKNKTTTKRVVEETGRGGRKEDVPRKSPFFRLYKEKKRITSLLVGGGR